MVSATFFVFQLFYFLTRIIHVLYIDYYIFSVKPSCSFSSYCYYSYYSGYYCPSYYSDDYYYNNSNYW